MKDFARRRVCRKEYFSANSVMLCVSVVKSLEKRFTTGGTEVTQRATETFFLGVEKPDYEQAESKLFDERV